MVNINKEFMSPACEKQTVSVSDIEIRKCIEKNEIEYGDNWEKYLNFAPERKNILAWYQFKEGAEVLEVDAGNGALTGLLCEKCAHVTSTVFSPFRAETIAKRYAEKENLDIYVGAVAAIKFEKKFDYVVLLGSLEGIQKEKREIYLKKLLQMLKPEGVILCAVDNKYAVRYLCGAREYHTGKAFDGVNGYKGGAKSYSFERSELQELFKGVGLTEQMVFYPVPDYIIPQAIYTDQYMPDMDCYRQMKTAYWGYDTLAADENEVFDAAIRNQAFHFVAPSFLLESSRVALEEQQLPQIITYPVGEIGHKNFKAKEAALKKIWNRPEVKLPAEEVIGIDASEYGRLEKTRAVQLAILENFKEICKKYQLRYFVFRGTLLGAVRHKGYIPWDDDIDVVMPRDDFEKFKKVVENELKENYFFQSSKTDKEFFWGSMCRIRDLTTTGICVEEVGTNTKSGIWIDILVLDNIFIDEKKQKKQLQRITFWNNILMFKTYGIKEGITDMLDGKEQKMQIASLFSREFLLKRYEAACKSCADDKTSIYSIFSRYMPKEKAITYDKRDFAQSLTWDFEDTKVIVPDGYDHILRWSMGKYYMRFPKPAQRVPKHNGIIDAEIPYWHFQQVWKKEWKENVIVLGEKMIINEFVRYFGSGKKIVHWSELQEKLFVESEYDVVICTDDYKKYIETLKLYNIQKYYVFVSEEIGVLRNEKEK